jgi:hypothetical protein
MTEPTLETIARQLEDGFKTLRGELDGLKRAMQPTTDAASLSRTNTLDDAMAAAREADRLLHQVKTRLPALETRVDDIDRRGPCRRESQRFSPQSRQRHLSPLSSHVSPSVPTAS